MKSHINILFLGGAKRVSLAERFIQSGKEMGFDVRIFSYELDMDVPVSTIARVILGKKWSDPEVIEDLKEVCYDERIHVVIPFTDPSTLIAARLKTEMSDLFIPVSDLELCEVFADRISSNNWFKEKGFSVPSEEPVVPVLARPRKGSGSKKNQVFREQKYLDDFLAKANAHQFLIQKLLEGDEFSVDVYVTSVGEVVSVVPRIRLEVTGGEVIKTMTVKDDNIIEMVYRMLKDSALIGPLSIQIIRDKHTGVDFFIKVNPRFAGGVIASIEAGADVPEMILRDYLGLPNYPVTDWKEGLLMMRAHREFFRYNNY